MKITFIIKTFKRPESLHRLLRSINEFYSGVKIIVVDDSSEESIEEHQIQSKGNVKYIRVPFNVGLSEGRNILLDYVKTEYFLLLDDDFILDFHSNIEAAYKIIVDEKIDILGGEVFDIVQGRDEIIKRDFKGTFRKENQTLLCSKVKSESEVVVCDFVLNFFIGKTSSVRKVKWREELKLLEHLDFFWRAKQNNLVVFHYRKMFCFHLPERPSDYEGYRKNNLKKYSKLLKNAIGVNKILIDKKEILG